MQKISLTRPGKAATTALAPSTATAWHAPTAGTDGAGYPPQPLSVDEQHWLAEGPGHSPGVEVPAQSDVHPQADPAPWQGDLVQQRTSAPSAGQAPGTVVPPEEEQVADVTQTPAMPEGP